MCLQNFVDVFLAVENLILKVIFICRNLFTCLHPLTYYFAKIKLCFYNKPVRIVFHISWAERWPHWSNEFDLSAWISWTSCEIFINFRNKVRCCFARFYLIFILLSFGWLSWFRICDKTLPLDSCQMWHCACLSFLRGIVKKNHDSKHTRNTRIIKTNINKWILEGINVFRVVNTNAESILINR